MSGLSPRQKAFADYYIELGNATKAAELAGYKNAATNTQKLLKNTKILKYIAERQKQIEDERICSIKEIQQIRTSIARGEAKDSLGFDPENSDRLKACADLEKSLRIKEQEEEKKRLEEAALRAKTYHLDLDIIPDSFHPVIRDIRRHNHLEYIFKGGRGSTKSSTVANVIPELMKNNHDVHALVCRQVGNTIKDSVYAKIKWALRKQEIEEEFDAKLSPLEITIKATGQKIYFRGADDPDKIKSISPEFGYIGILWLEELDQFAGPESVRKIEQSAIRGGENAWILKSFNPPKTMNNWANRYVKEVNPKTTVVHHSTYKDVPEEWLGGPFIEQAEHLKEVNPDAYDHEYGGEANGSGGLVFEFVEEREITDEEISHMDRLYCGIDFGWYPDQFCYLRTYYDAARETIYLIDELYVNKWSNQKVGNWIIEKGYNDYNITCDSAEPKSIKDLKDMDIPAKGAEKGPGSVEYSFKWLQVRKIVIDKRRTPGAHKEITTYEYEKDKDGNVISGYPDGNDHAISALRYAYEPKYKRRGSKA